MDSSTNQEYSNDEVTAKEFILRIQDYGSYFWRKKWWIVLSSLIFALVLFAKEFYKPITYTSNLTFMVSEEDSGGTGMASILGQFGIGGNSNGGFNKDKIVELSKSRRILQEIILQEVELGDQQNYVGNHIIEIYNLHEDWEENEFLESFYFEQDSVAVFDKKERMALQILHEKLRGTEDVPGIINTTYEEQTGILTITATTLDEVLSNTLSNSLYKKLSQFYIGKSIEKQLFTTKNLQQKSDSILIALNFAESQLAKLEDKSLGIQLRRDGLRRSRLTRQVQVLTIMYGETLKNLETADFMLKNTTPVFQVIDTPMLPLKPLNKGYVQNIILGGFFGGFLSVIVFTIYRIYRTIMKDSENI